MDTAPWELSVNEKSKPKLNTLGMQCQRKDIAQWLRTFWSMLHSLPHNPCVLQVPGCPVIFQIWATFGLCGHSNIFVTSATFSPVFSLLIAKVWPLASFILYGDVWPITSLGIWSVCSAITHVQLWFEQSCGYCRLRSAACHCWIVGVLVHIVWPHHFLAACRCRQGLEGELFLAGLCCLRSLLRDKRFSC